MASLRGSLVTETFAFDGGRCATTYVPPGTPDSVVFAAGFTPASFALPSVVPRTYLVGGRQEQWFLDNASSWAEALSATGADVAIEKREGEHGGRFWYDEFPSMVSWAFNG